MQRVSIMEAAIRQSEQDAQDAQDAEELNQKRPRGKRVLCLDGGGICGFTFVMIVQELERMTGRKVYDMFDLICGCSIGAGFGVITVSSDDPVAAGFWLLERMMSRVSNTFSISKFTSRIGFVDPDAVANYHRETFDTLGHDLVMRAAGNQTPHVCVVAARRAMLFEIPKRVLFTNYTLESDDALRIHDWRVYDVFRAVTGIPFVFPPFALGQYTYMDGMLIGYNSPIQLAADECEKIWTGQSIDILLSLGCGEINSRFSLPYPTRWKSDVVVGNQPVNVIRVNPPVPSCSKVGYKSQEVADLRKSVASYIQSNQALLSSIASQLA